MNLNQPSLVQFEQERFNNNYIPPLASNSFYTIGNGRINILTVRNDPDDYRFDLTVEEGVVPTGTGNFHLSGDIENINTPYRDLYVNKEGKLSVNHIFTISKGNLNVYGNLEILTHGQMLIRDKANIVFHPNSVFTINQDSKIIIDKDSTLTIYGEINIHLDLIGSVLGVDGIIIDSAAVMNVTGLETLGDRHYSMTNYYTDLSNRIINIHTQGEKNYANGRIGYTWTGGSPKYNNQTIQMSLLWGEAILGDFKLSVLGFTEEEIPNLQIISDILIKKNCILYIQEKYNGCEYKNPELYLGIIIGNNKVPGNCNIDGTVIVDGSNSKITVDRGATIHINEGGKLYLKNNAIMRSTYNEGLEVLFIDGTLIIDDIHQIDTFNADNIVFEDNGKVIILNPDIGEQRLLWTTPNGIESTHLYRLFKDRINHIEYHVSNNVGIGIDKFYNFYAREFVNWFGGRRFEKAIYDGILVWHDGAFIQLDSSIIPWVDEHCTLLQASRIFKSFGSFDEDKLQEVVDRLKYVGCGNILFKFVYGKHSHEIMLVLNDVKMLNVYNQPLKDIYVLSTDNDGQLFLKNNVGRAISTNIINDKARVVDIIDKKAEFNL